MAEAAVPVTIYHNPACGTSRNVLGLVRNAGIEPKIVEYLTDVPSKEVMLGLIARAGLTLREALRRKGTPYEDLGLDDPEWTDGNILDAVRRFPILLNRPFVVTPLGREIVPSIGDRPEHPAGSAEEALQQGRWRARRR
jgi:arsenate reductase